MEKTLAVLENKIACMNLSFKKVANDDYDGRDKLFTSNYFKRLNWEAKALIQAIEFFTGTCYEIDCDSQTWTFSLIEREA